jgi:hypothetical protein
MRNAHTQAQGGASCQVLGIGSYRKRLAVSRQRCFVNMSSIRDVFAPDAVSPGLDLGALTTVVSGRGPQRGDARELDTGGLGRARNNRVNRRYAGLVAVPLSGVSCHNSPPVIPGKAALVQVRRL